MVTECPPGQFSHPYNSQVAITPLYETENYQKLHSENHYSPQTCLEISFLRHPKASSNCSQMHYPPASAFWVKWLEVCTIMHDSVVHSLCLHIHWPFDLKWPPSLLYSMKWPHPRGHLHHKSRGNLIFVCEFSCSPDSIVIFLWSLVVWVNFEWEERPQA